MQSSILSVIMPDTPISEGEIFRDWLFQASFRAEMLFQMASLVAVLPSSFGDTECLDYISRLLAAWKIMQIIGRVSGCQREEFEGRWTSLTVTWLTSGLVLSSVAYHLQDHLDLRWLYNKGAGSTVCVSRSSAEFDLLWNDSTAVIARFSLFVGLSMGLKFNKELTGFKRAVRHVSIHICQVCVFLVVAQAAPKWKSSGQWAQVLGSALVSVCCQYIGLSASSKFMVQHFWYNRFLQAKEVEIKAEYCNPDCTAASASASGTGTGIGSDVDSDTEEVALGLRFSWEGVWDLGVSLVQGESVDDSDNSEMSDISVSMIPSTPAALSSSGCSQLSMPTSDGSQDPEVSTGVTSHDSQTVRSRETERPHKMPRLQSTIASESHNDSGGPVCNISGETHNDTPQIADCVAWLHPNTGDIVTSNPQFAFLAAQAGMTILQFIAKKLLLDLRVALATKTQTFIDHDEMTAGGWRIQGKAFYAGQFMMWIIHNYTLTLKDEPRMDGMFLDLAMKTQQTCTENMPLPSHASVPDGVIPFDYWGPNIDSWVHSNQVELPTDSQNLPSWDKFKHEDRLRRARDPKPVKFHICKGP